MLLLLLLSGGLSCAVPVISKIPGTLAKFNEGRNALVPAISSTNANMTFYADSGVFDSYNYPNNYNNGDNYYISVTVDPGYFVQMTLLDFVTEACCDTLTVWDGSDTTASPLAVYFGTQTGKYTFSKTNQLTMLFNSDITVNYRGFAVEYKETTDNTALAMTNQCPSVITTSQGGFITSPNWPLNYPNNISCDYSLTSTKSRVKLTFVAFATEGCCDRVTIYDGANSMANVIATISGDTLSNVTYVSSGPNMFITFSSDLTNNEAGFSAFFVYA